MYNKRAKPVVFWHIIIWGRIEHSFCLNPLRSNDKDGHYYNLFLFRFQLLDSADAPWDQQLCAARSQRARPQPQQHAPLPRVRARPRRPREWAGARGRRAAAARRDRPAARGQGLSCQGPAAHQGRGRLQAGRMANHKPIDVIQTLGIDSWA